MAQDDAREKRDSYEARRKRAAQRDRSESTAGKDIGPLPRPKNKRRREKCKLDLLKYLQTYHAESFPLAFSPDHLKFIAEIQKRVLSGGAKAQAMPRGSGKTTLMLAACCWAIAYGHRRFIVLVAAEQDAADELCDDLRTIWETNDLLYADFPEIAHPIRCLEGVVNRAKAQTLNGKQTFMRWSGSKLVLPTVPGSAAAGTVIRGRGLLARVRGMKSTTPSGETIRPDLVLVEDFQTDASADSAPQCAKREKVIGGAVLGLAGPGKRIAAFATCTVIKIGDAADRILNRKLYPKWHGERCKLVNAWPDESARPLWDKYQSIRQEELESGDDDHPKATAFYKKHRKKMDAGADVPWAERKFPHELSAVEHAENLRHDNPEIFDAEYQNEPKETASQSTELRLCRSDDYILAQAPTKRWIVPDDAQWLTVGIDVQKTLLFYLILAVDENFGATVIDYGSWPDQHTHYYSLADIEKTLHHATGIANDQAAIAASLIALTDHLHAQQYTRPDGQILHIDRGLIDAGYETQTVYKFASSTPHPYMAAMGFGVTASQQPWDRHKRRRGDRHGHHWKILSANKTAGVRRCDIDTNSWKTTVLPRWALPAGEPGRWTVYRRPPVMHRLLGDHLASEYPVKTAGRGRELYEWKLRPGAENHLLDCLIYASVAANLSGARAPDQTVETKTALPKTSGASKARSATGPRAEDKRSERPSLAELRERRRKKPNL